MELFFICPETKKEYATDNYRLLPGHHIVDDEDQRDLVGEVKVNSPCPHCNQLHIFKVNEILCPATRQNDSTK